MLTSPGFFFKEANLFRNGLGINFPMGDELATVVYRVLTRRSIKGGNESIWGRGVWWDESGKDMYK